MGEDVFLRLLIQEAPAEAFEEVVRSAREDGLDETEAGALEQQAALALQVRAVLEHRRRREQELAALYATAGDLTALRDVGAVLQAIVERARQLLGSDTTYLMLIDDQRGDTYMRVTDGTISADFERVRLDLGAGLGGLVAKTASPYYTANYFADERFNHVAHVDSAVGNEGLVAILGVPLTVGDRVLGVLFAANRRERPFVPQEVTLLRALAAHAAIALENARLFQEAQQALHDLNTANRAVQAHSQAVERAAEAHERLTTIVLQGGALVDVAEALADLLSGCLLVTDQEGRILASAGEPCDELHRRVLQEGRLGRSGPTAVPPRSAGRWALTDDTVTAGPGPTRPMVPIVAGSERLGTIVFTSAAEVDDADLRTLERGALVTALVLLNQRAVAEAEQRVRGELLDDLLRNPVADPGRLRRRARLLGLDLQSGYAVVVADGEAERGAALRAAAALAGDHRGLAGERDGAVVLLLRGLPAGDAARLVARRLKALLGAPVTAGAAGPATGVEAIAATYREATACLRALLALGHHGSAASVEDLGAYALLLSQAGGEALDRFVERQLGPALAYDAERGTDLHGTLEAYFATAGNLSRTAQRLHIHVNTLYQRLERLSRLLGEDWREGDAALHLHLALRLHRLRHGAPPAAVVEPSTP